MSGYLNWLMDLVEWFSRLTGYEDSFEGTLMKSELKNKK